MSMYRTGSRTGKLSARDMAQIGMMTALMAVCAWVTVPFTIPFTLQTFGVFITLRLLGGQLSREIRRQADDFLVSEGASLRNEQAVRADCVPAEGGMYNVILRVTEGDTSVMEIRLQVPDKALAEEICRKWHEKNEQIYNSLIENLF